MKDKLLEKKKIIQITIFTFHKNYKKKNSKIKNKYKYFIILNKSYYLISINKKIKINNDKNKNNYTKEYKKKITNYIFILISFN